MTPRQLYIVHQTPFNTSLNNINKPTRTTHKTDARLWQTNQIQLPTEQNTTETADKQERKQ
jgi:hypothetical protein